ncbi:MAG: hypothetical protein IJ975_01740 [Clostridia bacterium]|nr:hypothetical protein [Clostridia bacterium]
MEIKERYLDFLKACAIIGESQVDVTPALEAKVHKTLTQFVKEKGYRYFYFGPIGPFETLCFKHLRELQKSYPDIILINFRMGNELAFNAGEASFFKGVLAQENVHTIPHTVFDGTIVCDGEIYPGVKKTYIDRNRDMIKRVITVLMYFNHAAEKMPHNLRFDTRDFLPEKSGIGFAYEYAKMRPCNLINLAEEK